MACQYTLRRTTGARLAAIADDSGKTMEGDIHCPLGWVGALARPSPAIFRNYRSVSPGITMTALGQKRKCPGSRGTSVLPSGADIVSLPQHVRLVPIAEAGPTRSPHQHGEKRGRPFAINYDGNPGQDDRPAGPALQVSRAQSW